MTTLQLLRARIADDLLRSDINSQIEDAIATAIDFYQDQRLYFNETRLTTFPTVAAQSTYSAVDNDSIPLLVKLDDVFLVDSGGDIHCLNRYDPMEMEGLLETGAATGRPYAYAYYEQSFRFYPVPDAVYTIRPVGVIKKAAPVSGTEAGNVWMTDAFELIRCRAKGYLALHVLRDPELLMMMVGPDGNGGAAGDALGALRAESNKKFGSGTIVRTAF